MGKNGIIGALCIIFAAALWGLDGIVLRPSLYHLDVPVVVFLEHSIAFLLMSVFLMYEVRYIRRFTTKAWISMFWVALFGGAIGTMAITKALFLVNFQHLSAIIILQKLQPIFAIFLAYIILKERPPRQFYTWTIIALIGSYLVTFGIALPDFSGSSIAFAAMLSLLAAFAWGSSTVLGRNALKSGASFQLATYVRFGLTSMIMLAFLLATSRRDAFITLTQPNLVTLVIIALTTGGTAIFIYYYGLKKIPASRATIYELAFPVTAVLLDYFVNNSIMGPAQWVGAALIFGAMIRITQTRNR